MLLCNLSLNSVIIAFFGLIFAQVLTVAFVQNTTNPQTRASPMAEFDTISKHLIQKYPDDFAGFILGRENIEVLAVIPTVEHAKPIA